MYNDKKHIRFSYLLVDSLLIAVSFYAAYCLRYNDSLASKVFPYLRESVILFVFWGAALVFLMENKQLYSTDRSLTIPRETWRVFVCVMVSSVLAGLVVFILKMKPFSRLIFLESLLFLFLSLSFWRAIKRAFIRYRLSRGFYNLNVLIVGLGEEGLTLAQEFKNRHYLGRKVAGFFEAGKKKNMEGYSVLSSNIDELEYLIKKHFIDEVYVTVPFEHHLVPLILLIGERTNTAVRVLLDRTNPSFGSVDMVQIGFLNFVEHVEVKSHVSDILAKRIFDILVSVIGIIILIPFFIIIGILIKLDSPGPVFYTSKRCSKNGKIFNFYKFRSMVVGADKQKEALRDKSDVSGPVFKMKNDSRVTTFGKFLRTYSLDELPQLFNVLKGDMSLVGPRPPTPDEVKEYDIYQLRRLSIKSGITCLWQVRGRSELSFYKWMKLDLWYIDNWSFALDLQILYWTILSVLKKRGAY